MNDIFYKYLFNSQYETACEHFNVLLPNSPANISHYNLARFLCNPNLTCHDFIEHPIDSHILELEALRLESVFDYGKALELRYAILKQVDSECNHLSIIDIKLKIKPIDECNLNYLDTLSPNRIEQSQLLQKRILNILEFISDNAGHIIIPKSLIQIVKYTFESHYKNEFSFNSAQNLVRTYFYLQDYESALKILDEVNNSIGLNDILSDILVRANIKLGNFEYALDFCQQYLKKYPFSIRIINRLGLFLKDFGRLNDAMFCFRQAYDELLFVVKSKLDLANSYRRLGSYIISHRLYFSIISLIPVYNQISFNIATLLNDTEEIYTLCKQSVVSIPNSSYGAFAMALLAKKSGELELSIIKSAWELIPYSWHIAEAIISLVKDKDQSTQEEFDDLKLKEEICLQFVRSENEEYKLSALISLSLIYLYQGFLTEVYQILDIFQEVIIKSENVFLNSVQSLNFYFSLCFIIPSIRDSVFFNNLIFSTISKRVAHVIYNWKKCLENLYGVNLSLIKKNTLIKKNNSRPLRIGFVSPNFKGHVVSLLSIDVIREMSLIPDLEIMMIAVDKSCKDSEFLKAAKEIPSLQVVELYESIFGSILSLFNLELDVLVDLDGVTAFLNSVILFFRPAIVNCSWLGFDAPYISDQNYFFCDSHTHPLEVDEFYTEKLVRLPHAHMCVGEFKVSDKDVNLARKELDISEDQLVFIYPCGVRKFNYNSATAHVEILSKVPNSILLIKSYSGTPKLLEIWKEECENFGVDYSRIKSAPTIPDVEQHRLLLKLSDVYLDAYPYNGGSISLEALWCELPIVTYCGEQSFARMGYSLLTTAGITEGIAHSWGEYVEWAVRLATDRDLRLSIKERLAKGKDPNNLCPLWNPKQFARDMYDILQDLYEQAQV